MRKWMKSGKIAGLAALVMTLSISGCGQSALPASDKGDVALLEPEGIALSYEEAAFRDLYDATVLDAVVTPYTEAYCVEKWLRFGGYVALPGTAVSRGDRLIDTNTESIEENIKAKKEYIAEMQESYNEFWSEKKEELAKQTADRDYCAEVVERFEDQKPDQYITQTSPEGVEVQVENPEYTAWANDSWFKKFKTDLMNSAAKVQELEEEIKQRTELFELDLKYQKLLLKRLQEDKNSQSLTSEMDGTVTSIRSLQQDQGIMTEDAVVAVSDLNQKLLKTDFINKTEISRAEDVYAIANGERFEVEYQIMDSEEFNRLKKENRKICSTFRLIDPENKVSMGQYVAIVVKKQTKQQVLTIPQSAITWTEGSANVYILKDGNSESITIQVGMKDGMYAEVLSGLNPGDKIITEKATVAGTKTITLQKGSMKNTMSDSGKLVYPINQSVYNPVEYGTCYLDEVKVETFQHVQKGDVLMTIRVTPDTISLERKERELQRAKERLEDTKASHKDDTSKDYQKYLESENERIVKMEEVIRDMKKDFATTEIKAPISGIVVSYFWGFESGEMLNKNELVCVLAEQSSNFISLEDEKGLLTYGMEADIEYSDANGEKKTAKGMVVSVDQALLEKDLNDKNLALIQVSAEYIGEMASSAMNWEHYRNPSYFKVSIVSRSMENVVLVPRNAVTFVGSTTYVKLKKENGEVIYQSFVAGGSDNSNYWVADGLTEGMEVCIE